MTSPLEQRVKAAIRVIAEQPLAEPPPLPARPSRRPVWTFAKPAAAALAVLLVMLVFIVRPPSAPSEQAGSAQKPVVPTTFAAFSMLTAKLSDAPLGQPGIAIVAQGKPGITGLFTQVIVVGADGYTYRRVDLAEDRGGRGSIEGELQNAQAVLSPDGQRVAIGHYFGGATEIPILNLVTGQRRDYPLPEPMAYSIAAWSADGRKLALLLQNEPAPVDDLFGGRVDGTWLALLDLDSGAISRVPGLTSPLFMSTQFGPSGRLFTVVSGTVRLIDFASATDGAVHEIPQLVGDVMLWSHDETQVVLWSGDDDGTTIRVKDMAGQDVRAAIRLAGKQADPVAWHGNGKLLMFDQPNGELLELTLQTGQFEVVSRFDTWVFGDAFSVRFADGLIDEAHFAETSPQRGPWPLWMWTAVALTAALMFAVIRRRLKRPAR